MAVGRASNLKYVKYGSWVGAWVGTGIALQPTHPIPTTPGTPSPYPYMPYVALLLAARLKEAVGLKSVDQLSLGTHFSGFRGMTEVYNLSIAGNPNDHFYIPGNE